MFYSAECPTFCRVGNGERAAGCNSAIQQSTTLRYFKSRSVARSALRLFALIAFASTSCSAQQSLWHTNNHYRWRGLQVSNQGRTGFEQLSAELTGIHFTNNLDEAASAANRILEDGSGVAIGDFDGDGRPDIFLCSLEGRNALYRNPGGWRFEDVTARAGIDATNYVCRGAVFADINGDGWLDLLISTLGHGVLCFVNQHNGTFTNFTREAGTETEFGSTSMTLADVAGDGALALYVANYRTSDIRDRARIDVKRVNGRVVFAAELQDRLMLGKEGLMEFGEPDCLYLNDGHGHFR